MIRSSWAYSRDQRPDCRQVVIAVVLNAGGFPLAYEIMHGNTSDKTTLQLFLQKIGSSLGSSLFNIFLFLFMEPLMD